MIEKYLAADLKCLFGHTGELCPVRPCLPPFCAHAPLYKLDLRIVETRPGRQPDALFEDAQSGRAVTMRIPYPPRCSAGPGRAIGRRRGCCLSLSLRPRLRFFTAISPGIRCFREFFQIEMARIASEKHWDAPRPE